MADEQPLDRDGKGVRSEAVSHNVRDATRPEFEWRGEGAGLPFDAELGESHAQRARREVEGDLRGPAAIVSNGRRAMLGAVIRERDFGGLCLIQRGGELAHGGRAVHVADSDCEGWRQRADAGTEARHEQRVTAVIGEEIAVDGYLVEIQCFTQRLTKHFLRRRSGGTDATVEDEPRRPWSRKPFTISFVTCQRWEHLQPFEICGHHIGGKARAQEGQYRVSLWRLNSAPDRVVSHQLLRRWRYLSHGRRGLRNPRQFQQHGFDFAKFDAVSAQLDLGIDAAEEFNLALVVDAAEIAGAVNAGRGIVREPEKVGDKLRFGQVRPVEIAFGNADAGNADFARFVQRQGCVLLRVKNDDAVSRQRLTDGHGPARGQFTERGRNRRFRRPIGVEELAPRRSPPRDQRGRAGLAADEQHAQPRQVMLHRSKQGRYSAEAGNSTGLEKIRQFVTEQSIGRRIRHERRPSHERHPEFFDGEVEGDRQALIDTVAGTKSVKFGRDLHEVADAVMRHRDALRLTGGAGSVKDIAKGAAGSTGGDLRRRRRVERAYVVTCRVERDRRDSALYEAHREGTLSNDACRGGVGKDVGDPIRRLIGVERNIRCARL